MGFSTVLIMDDFGAHSAAHLDTPLKQRLEARLAAPPELSREQMMLKIDERLQNAENRREMCIEERLFRCARARARGVVCSHAHASHPCDQ